ncbi:hypothetical protein TWF694_001329 [Orbilia ellipsospora]|uniref:Purine nucleoside permease n=1 Tax=Orbilia ellipsospora TaxID=2528407 RepID=A0AAV9XRB5_9PEZI
MLDSWEIRKYLIAFKPSNPHYKLYRRGVPKIQTLLNPYDGPIIKPRIFIISLFTPEAGIWLESDLGLYAQNITVPGLSPLFPQVHCDEDRYVCQVTTGEGEINAATTIHALTLYPFFDLTLTYFLIAGIAGVSPHHGTLGSVTYARYAVQFGLEYEIDSREKPADFFTGYVPLGAKFPTEYPQHEYGTEVFELNVALRDHAASLASGVKLTDSAKAEAFRTKFLYAPANQPPGIIKCETATSDTYWHGELIAKAVEEYTKLLTNGTGNYCMAAQEDSAVLEVMVRSAARGAVDFSRIILTRSAANFDRPPPGYTAAQDLFNATSGGFPLSLANLYKVNRPFVDDVKNLSQWRKASP